MFREKCLIFTFYFVGIFSTNMIGNYDLNEKVKIWKINICAHSQFCHSIILTLNILHCQKILRVIIAIVFNSKVISDIFS